MSKWKVGWNPLLKPLQTRSRSMGIGKKKKEKL